MVKEIVSLILEKDGKILAEKRKKSKSTVPGAIIFPAGHVEEGETREQALIREMKEELGISISNPFLVYEADFNCEEEQKIFWYSCRDYTGKIKNSEAEELIWMDPSDKNLLTFQVGRDALNKFLELKKLL